MKYRRCERAGRFWYIQSVCKHTIFRIALVRITLVSTLQGKARCDEIERYCKG